MASSCASWLELEVGVLVCLAVALVVALEVGALVWLAVLQGVALRPSRSSALFPPPCPSPHCTPSPTSRCVTVSERGGGEGSGDDVNNNIRRAVIVCLVCQAK